MQVALHGGQGFAAAAAAVLAAVNNSNVLVLEGGAYRPMAGLIPALTRKAYDHIVTSMMDANASSYGLVSKAGGVSGDKQLACAAALLPSVPVHALPMLHR